jgi:hypothetical protein
LEQAHRRARSYLIYRDPKLDRYQSGAMKFGITPSISRANVSARS